MRHKWKLVGASGKEVFTDKRDTETPSAFPPDPNPRHCDIHRECSVYGKYFWLMMAEEKDRKTVGFDGMDKLLNYLPAEFD